MRFGAATLVARFGSRSIALAREVRSGQLLPARGKSAPQTMTRVSDQPDGNRQ